MLNLQAADSVIEKAAMTGALKLSEIETLATARAATGCPTTGGTSSRLPVSGLKRSGRYEEGVLKCAFVIART